MQNILTFKDDKGGVYEVPENELGEFQKALPDAIPTTTYKNEAGKLFAVPPQDTERFMQSVPDAKPALQIKTEDGEKYGVPVAEAGEFYDWYRKAPEMQKEREKTLSEIRADNPAEPSGAGQFAKDVGKGVVDAFTKPPDLDAISKGGPIAGIQTALMDMIGGASSATAAITTTPLGNAFDFVADKLGLAGEDRQTAFGRWTDGIVEAAQEYGMAADELIGPQGTAGNVIRGLNKGAGSLAGVGPAYAAAAPTLGLATLPAFGALEASDTGDVKQMAMAAVKGLALGSVMKGMGNMPRALRMAGGGAAFGGLAASEGGDTEDVVTSAIMGAGLSAMGGKGKSFKQAKADVSNALKTVTDSQWYRKATIKQRGLVTQTIAQQVSGLNAQGMTEGQILRELKRVYGTENKAWQEAWSKRGGASAGKEVKSTTPSPVVELQTWAQLNPEKALEISKMESPSRNVFEKAGLPRVPKDQRIAMAGTLRDMSGELESSIASKKIADERLDLKNLMNKEAWEMTAAEHAGITIRNLKGEEVPIISPDQHKSIIKRALAEGKDVPAVVLADFPELKPVLSTAKKRKAEAPVEEEPVELSTKEEKQVDNKPSPVPPEKKIGRKGVTKKQEANPEQMTRDEYIEFRGQTEDTFGNKDRLLNEHALSIRQAIADGKPVNSAEADYYGEQIPSSWIKKGDLSLSPPKVGRKGVKKAPAAEKPGKVVDTKEVPELLEKVSRPPKNTSRWPNPTKKGYNVTFMPYGFEGAGFYQAPATKQPWQMTRSDYVISQEPSAENAVEITRRFINKVASQQVKDSNKKQDVLNRKLRDGKISDEEYTEILHKNHKDKSWIKTNEIHDLMTLHEQSIKKAIAEGKDVPAEVLADYPDMKTTTTPAAPAPAAEPKTIASKNKVTEKKVAQESLESKVDTTPVAPSSQKATHSAQKSKGLKKKAEKPAKKVEAETETKEVKIETEPDGDIVVTSPLGESRATIGNLTPKAQKEFLISEVAKVLAEAPEEGDGKTTVTFEVPGDGTFIIPNNKSALEDFQNRTKKFPSSIAKTENAKKPTLKKKPTSIPKVPKTRPSKRADIDRIMKDALSTDPIREVLNSPHLNGEVGELVATDGRRMSVVLGQSGKTTIHKGVEGVEIDFPKYGQAVPGYRAGQLPELQKNKSTVNTAYMISKLNMVRAISAGIIDPDPVQLVRMPNGSIELKWEEIKAGNTPTDADVIEMYQSNDVDGGEVIGKFDTDNLKGAFTTIRKMGNEDVTLTWRDSYAPFVAVGNAEYEVVMPKLTKAESLAAEKKRKSAEAAAAPGTENTITGKIGAKGVKKKPSETQYSPASTLPSPSIKSRGIKKADVQKNDIINAIKRDWPEISLSGFGTFKIRKYDGFYNSTLGTINLKDVRNVRVALHELGHHYDNIVKKVTSPGMNAELNKLGVKLYGKTKPAVSYESEGFAEYIRMYLSGDSAVATEAPLINDWFTNHLAGNPKDAKRIRNLEQLVVNWETQTPTERIRAFRQPLKKDWSVKHALARASAWVDDYIRDTNLVYKRVMDEAGVVAEEADKNPYMLATALSQSAPGRVKHAVMVATTDMFGNETGESLYQAKKEVSALGPEAEEQFWDYMIARRVIDLDARKINSGIPVADAKAVVGKYESPIFNDAARRVSEWSNRILEPLVDAGVLSKQELADIESNNPVYVPFARRFSEGDLRKGKAGSSGKGVYRIKGSGREIKHPLDAMIWQAERIYTVAAQAMVKKSVVEVFNEAKKTGKHDALGKLLRPVPAPIEATTFSAEQLKSTMKAKAIELGADPQQVADEMMNSWDESLTIYTKASQYKGSQHITSIKIDGQTQWFEVTPEFYDALNGMNAVSKLDSPLWETIRTASKMSVQLARLGATGLNPGFGIVRNLIRDDTTTFVTGDYRTRIPLFTNLEAVLEEAFVDNEKTRRYNAMAVSLSGWYGQDNRSTNKLKGQSSATTFGKKVMVEIKHPVELARNILGATEAGPRFAEFKAAYKSVIDAGGTPNAASVTGTVASKDVSVNFGRAGKITREANLVSLFLNAGVQSIDKFGRSFYEYKGKKNIPKATARTLVRAGSWITMMSLISYFKNRDEDWWKDLPPYEKWTHTHWKVGDTTIRVPQAFEFGLLFGSLPMALIEESRTPGSLEEWKNEFFSRALPVDVKSPGKAMRSVQLIAPLVDVMANEDWKGQEIVKDYIMESKEKQDWYGDETSDFTIKMTKFIADNSSLKISPAQLEHAIHGYTGGLFKRAAKFIDTIKDPSIMKEKSSLPVIGTLFLRDNTSRIPSDFYKRQKDLRQKVGSNNGSIEEIGELYLSEKLSKELSDKWSDRREIRDAMKAGAAKPLNDKILKSISSDIKEHNKQDFKEAGIQKLAYMLSESDKDADDIAKAKELLKDMDFKDVYKAFTKKWISMGTGKKGVNRKAGTDAFYKRARLIKERLED